MSNLSEIVENKKGKLSARNIALLGVTFVPLIVWAVLSFIKGDLLDMPQSITYIIGILALGKAVGDYVEEKVKTQTK